jgi:transposase
MLLTMKEKQRIDAIQSVMDDKITVADASRVLGLSERHVWRLLAAIRANGLEAVSHGNRGRRPWNRADGGMWEEILALIRKRYANINDLHLKEILEREHQIVVGRESLRQKLRAAGIGPKRKRRIRKSRSRRERKPAAGVMLQIDASPHDWLEGRGPRLTLVGAIDDATSFGWYQFFESETTWAYLTLMRRIFLSVGLPMSLYSDRHDIFHPRREPTIIEQLNDEPPLSQFGRAMDTLGIRIIPAYSAQAKGRIERQWETFQDRLVVELRLAQANNIDQANHVLNWMLKSYNSSFTVQPRESVPVWRKAPRAHDLDRILCLKDQRTVALDHTVRFENLVLQIPRTKLAPSLANQHVAVLQLKDGSVEILHRERRVARFTKTDIALLRKDALPHNRARYGIPSSPVRRGPVPPPSGGTGGGRSQSDTP